MKLKIIIQQHNTKVHYKNNVYRFYYDYKFFDIICDKLGNFKLEFYE